MLTTTTSVKASKTWVLPPRPKPGRKSKKDLAAAAAKAGGGGGGATIASTKTASTIPTTSSTSISRVIDNADDDDESEEAEKVLNRTKQKASRERKQEYIAELEAKVRSYEQGDGERASFFQNLAKTYSEQNAALKRENEELRARLAALEAVQSSSRSATPSSIQLPNNTTSTTTTNESRLSAHLARKASSDITFQASRFKRQRTKSISSVASTSSHHGTTTASLAASTSATTAGSSTAANMNAYSPAGTSGSSSHTSVPYLYSQHNTPSPASSSSYVPPSPPVSLGLSPVLSPQPYPVSSTSTSTSLPAAGSSMHPHKSSTCGLCDTNAGVSCICEDIGLRDRHADKAEGYTDDITMETASLAMTNDMCGFCTESTTGACICAEVGLRKRNSITHLAIPSMDLEEPSMKVTHSRPRQINIPTAGASISPTLPSIAVPESKSVRLRLPKRGVAVGQVWRIDMLPPASSKLDGSTTKLSAPVPAPVPIGPAAAAGVALRRKLIKVGSRLPCSGDPKTCLACADDPAGQAFCSALSSTICSTNPCANCPNRPSPLSKEISMLLRPKSPYATESFTVASLPSIKRQDSSARDEIPHAMIPCSDAWATLREHPNIGYANLDMLASVVAKRTQCSGEIRDKDGKIMEVEQQGVEEALELLDHMRDKEVTAMT